MPLNWRALEGALHRKGRMCVSWLDAGWSIAGIFHLDRLAGTRVHRDFLLFSGNPGRAPRMDARAHRHAACTNRTVGRARGGAPGTELERVPADVDPHQIAPGARHPLY